MIGEAQRNAISRITIDRFAYEIGDSAHRRGRAYRVMQSIMITGIAGHREPSPQIRQSTRNFLDVCARSAACMFMQNIFATSRHRVDDIGDRAKGKEGTKERGRSRGDDQTRTISSNQFRLESDDFSRCSMASFIIFTFHQLRALIYYRAILVILVVDGIIHYAIGSDHFGTSSGKNLEKTFFKLHFGTLYKAIERSRDFSRT